MWQAPGQIQGEEEYFRRHDAELIEEMRKRAAKQERRRCLALNSQIMDPRILESLERLGFNPETVPLLKLVPMIQVAWSDGCIGEAERQCIVRAARDQIGVAENGPAWRQLMAWLDTSPRDYFFRGALSAIHDAIASRPPEDRKTCRETIARECTEVAAADCGFPGWRTRICGAKKKLVAEIISYLDSVPAAQER